MKNNKQFKNGHSGMFTLKNLAAAVVLSSVAGAASAEIVIGETETTTLSMYGIVDIGLIYQSEVSVGGDEKFDVHSSGIGPTILGFKGTREMSGSTSAFFNLEAHFDLDTGRIHGSGEDETVTNGTDIDVFFRRQANLGLTGDWGTLIAGRQYTPAILAHLGTEVRGFKENFSNTYAWAFSSLSNGAFGADYKVNRNDIGFFVANSVQYRNSFDGFEYGILYGVGGQEGTSNGDFVSLGVSYTEGPLILAASYQTASDDTTGEDVINHWSVGTAYDFGDITLKANYLAIENNDKDDGSKLLDLASTSVGIDWRWAHKNSATVAYYHNEDKLSGETNTLVLSNDYKMDDQTTLYAQMAYADADDTLTTLGSWGTTVATAATPIGEKTTTLNVGVNFTF